jgi:hypothetical protein
MRTQNTSRTLSTAGRHARHRNRCHFSVRLVAAATAAIASTSVQAGHGQGDVGAVMVGRNGYEVYVELLNFSVASWPCAGTHPNGWRYAFLLNQGGGKEMLATILAAKASERKIQVVDTGGCTIDPTLANAHYVIQL